MVRSIEERVAAYAGQGYGPLTVARFERALREAAELGPLGAVQADISRLTAAITGGAKPQGPFAPAALSRLTGLAADAVDMPLKDVRRVRDTLRRALERAGLPTP